MYAPRSKNPDEIADMHTFDSLAKSLARPARARPLRSERSGSATGAVVSVFCVLAPLGMMVRVYLLTA
jgi:hypothetical protein